MAATTPAGSVLSQPIAWVLAALSLAIMWKEAPSLHPFLALGVGILALILFLTRGGEIESQFSSIADNKSATTTVNSTKTNAT